MFPLNAIPVPGNTKFQVFYTSNPVNFGTTVFQAWQKPAGCSMVYIFAMAGGGGGGRPPDGASTVGGGGGGSSAVTRALIPAILLPDTIYVLVGRGGLGATTANTAGETGYSTWIKTQPIVSGAADSIIRVYPGSGGAASTTGGTAGQGSPPGENAFASLGLWYTIAGQAGANGATVANGNGTSVTPFASGIITTGGSGGGNGTQVGGNISAAGQFLSQNIVGGSGGGGNGNSGFQRSLPILQGLKTMPLLFTGATGGGGHSTGTAGRGGDASYGGGGGGGGGCSGAGTSGNGGNGGDGFVIIGTF